MSKTVEEMAQELAEKELHSTMPSGLLKLVYTHRAGALTYAEVMDTAREIIERQWWVLANDIPSYVRMQYESEIGLDGFN